jgi:hypothetical protein
LAESTTGAFATPEFNNKGATNFGNGTLEVPSFLKAGDEQLCVVVSEINESPAFFG